MIRPPQLAVRLLNLLVPHEIAEQLRQDLHERFAAMGEAHGWRAANRWYWRQVVKSVRWASLGDRPRATVPAPQGDGRLGWLRRDVKAASRSLRHTPGFTAAALSLLMLGIGGTTAVFSVLNAVLLRPLPYENPDRIAVIWTINGRQNIPDGSSWLNVTDWQARSRSFTDFGFFNRPDFTTATITDFDRPERVDVGVVSHNFFNLLGVTPTTGRAFSAADSDGDDQLIVIGDAFWRNRYGADPSIIGQTLGLDGERYRIVGVAPPDLQLPRTSTQLWRLNDPTEGPWADLRTNDTYVILARLADGVTMDAAQVELAGIAAQLAIEYPETNRNLGVSVNSLLAEITGEQLPQILWMVFGAVILVLLVTCTNVAHLMLARSAQRRRELAVRAALGANRSTLARQLLTENAVLALAGGVGGILLGTVLLKALTALAPADVPRLAEARLDRTVLGVALVASLLTIPLFGLVPAIVGARQDPALALRAGGRGSSGTHRRLRGGLVVAEVTLAVLLLGVAGLLVRSVQAIRNVDPGFDAARTLVAQLDLPIGVYTELEQQRAYYDGVLARIRAIPGVTDAGAITDFFIHRFPDSRITRDGDPPGDPSDAAPRLTGDVTYPGFFTAAGIELMEGRTFDPQDLQADGDQPVIINQAMAQAFWPTESAVGRNFRWGSRTEGPVLTVIGVIADMRRRSLDEDPFPNIFTAGARRNMDLVIRTRGTEPLGVASQIEQAVHAVDPAVPVTRIGTAWTRFGDSMAGRQFQALLLGLFSALAILLASVGLYALLHDAVVNRRRELAIRLALGAEPRAVRLLVIREGLLLSLGGLAIGLTGAVVISRLAAHMLFEVAPTDPVTLGLVSAVLLIVAGTASWIPARRATAVPPSEALGE